MIQDLIDLIALTSYNKNYCIVQNSNRIYWLQPIAISKRELIFYKMAVLERVKSSDCMINVLAGVEMLRPSKNKSLVP